MAHLALLRAVNVGGSRAFKPSQLADRVPELEMTSLGAAGTYVVRAEVTADEVAEVIGGALPFETEVLVLPGQAILELLEADPLGRMRAQEGVKAYLSALAAPPAEVPSLPLERPPGEAWQLRLVEVTDRWALSLRRPDRPGRFYPNGVVEKVLGVASTTRGWPTIERVGRLLGEA